MAIGSNVTADRPEPSSPAASKERRVLVVERVGESAWRALCARIGGARIVVEEALDLSDSGGAPAALPEHADACLVLDSGKTLCRFLEMVEAPRKQLEQMVALRLEAELPYAVEDSTWVCERQVAGNGAPGEVLVAVAAKSAIADAEESLKQHALNTRAIEIEAASLAELGHALAAPDETVAVAALKPLGTGLVVLEAGNLRYVRHIDVADGETEQLANQLGQSLFDHRLRGGGKAPTRLLLAGAADPELISELEAHLEIPVEQATLPERIEVAAAVFGGELVRAYPLCLGALLAMHRRARGERCVAPVLRAAPRKLGTLGKIDFRGRKTTLLAANLALCLVLALSCWAVRAVRHGAAERIVEDARPLQRDFERLEEEVSILSFESRRQRSTLAVLLALSEVLPKGIEIEALTIDANGGITLSGKTKSVEAVSDQAVAAMNESPLFLAPKFLGAIQEKDKIGFRMTCKLRGGAGRKTP